MAENAVLYTAVYSTVNAALADLDDIEQLHKDKMVGKYDAAVVDKENGEPHIVKRVDRPRVSVIPEWFGKGALPRQELKDAAQELTASEAGLVVVGEPTVAEGVDKAVTRADKIVRRDLDTATDQLASEVKEASKE
jgi:hypothetical protein